MTQEDCKNACDALVNSNSSPTFLHSFFKMCENLGDLSVHILNNKSRLPCDPAFYLLVDNH